MQSALIALGGRSRTRRAARGLALAVALAAGGCAQSPFGDSPSEELRRAIVQASAKEFVDANTETGPVVTERELETARDEVRPDILAELDEMAGPKAWQKTTAEFGQDLLGRKMKTVKVSLERAVQSAAEQNMAVQFARLGPGIGEAQVVSAAAAFDWVFTSNTTWNNSDEPRVSTSVNNSAFGSSSTMSQNVTQQLGLRRNTISGGRLTLQHEYAYTDDQSRGVRSRPNPANLASFTVQFDQPLLKSFGSEVSQAEIRVARNVERNAVLTLKRDLIRTATDTERTYWQLVQSYQDLLILQRLLASGEETASVVRNRRQLDANDAQVANAEARVKRRRADVLRAQTQLRLLSDRLKQLMNSPELPVGSEVLVLPSDLAIDAPVKFSLRESIRSGLQFRPEVHQAITGIDDASIRQMVADNSRLPDLNLRLQARSQSLDNTAGEAFADAGNTDFVSYLATLVFEYPLGNRKGEADYVRRRLERMQTVLAYRNQVQTIVTEVKSALVRVQLNFRLIAQSRDARLSETNALRVLRIDNEVKGRTIERLDLELNRQEGVASAEREEVQAVIEYNIALADLFAAMGTTLERNNIQFVVPDGPSIDLPDATPVGWEYKAPPRTGETLPPAADPAAAPEPAAQDQPVPAAAEAPQEAPR
ncbi:MAG: TolC family protein [Phycisphaerales bacterium]